MSKVCARESPVKRQ